MTPPRVLVAGAGAWGTALACVCARAGCHSRLWGRDRALIETLTASRHHPGLAGHPALEPAVEPVSTLAAAASDEMVICATPFQSLREVLGRLHEAGVTPAGIACASKGIELNSLALAADIVADVWGPELPFAQISGPNFAGEVLAAKPAAITVGAVDAKFGQMLVAALRGARFRPYLTDDAVGVQIGGALKNVIAIAAGIADGLMLGANTRAALITRGLAEISRFGHAFGARPETFMGLSGMGDLVLTCSDDQSRNRRFGLALAQSGDPAAAAAAVGALVEGATTAPALAAKAASLGIDLPIAGAVAAVLAGESDPEGAVAALLARELRPETD